MRRTPGQNQGALLEWRRLYKRLEQNVFQWPRNEGEAKLPPPQHRLEELPNADRRRADWMEPFLPWSVPGDFRMTRE